MAKKRSTQKSLGNDFISTRQLNKNTTAFEQEHSFFPSRINEKDNIPATDERKAWRKKLTKKETLMFRPNEDDNKLLETIILKALPEHERYKINVIPCNTNTMSRKSVAKSRSLEVVVAAKIPEVGHRVASNIEFDTGVIEQLTKKNLEMIALKTKAINRKITKNKSKD